MSDGVCPLALLNHVCGILRSASPRCQEGDWFGARTKHSLLYSLTLQCIDIYNNLMIFIKFDKVLTSGNSLLVLCFFSIFSMIYYSNPYFYKVYFTIHLLTAVRIEIFLFWLYFSKRLARSKLK